MYPNTIGFVSFEFPFPDEHLRAAQTSRNMDYIGILAENGKLLVLSMVTPMGSVKVPQTPCVSFAFQPPAVFAPEASTYLLAMAAGKGSRCVLIVDLVHGDRSELNVPWATAVSYSPNGRYIAVGCADGELSVHEAIYPFKRIGHLGLGRSPVVSVALSRGEPNTVEPLFAYAVQADGAVSRCRISGKKPVRISALPNRTTHGVSWFCTRVATHAQSDLAAFAGLDDRVLLVDYEGPSAEILVHYSMVGAVRDLQFLPSHSRLAITGEAGVEAVGLGVKRTPPQRFLWSRRDVTPRTAVQQQRGIVVLCC